MKKINLPRGLRNNNPGNIRNNQKCDWQGEVREGDKVDDTFEEFTDIRFGYRALLKLLRNYRNRYKCMTITDFIRRWAPAHENNTNAYISVVCQRMQVPTTYIPDVDDATTMCSFAAAISFVENGVEADMDVIYEAWRLL